MKYEAFARTLVTLQPGFEGGSSQGGDHGALGGGHDGGRGPAPGDPARRVPVRPTPLEHRRPRRRLPPGGGRDRAAPPLVEASRSTHHANDRIRSDDSRTCRGGRAVPAHRDGTAAVQRVYGSV